jgi:hypothetical protein
VRASGASASRCSSLAFTGSGAAKRRRA